MENSIEYYFLDSLKKLVLACMKPSTIKLYDYTSKAVTN